MKMGNLLVFPLNRVRLTSDVNPTPGVVVPFPRQTPPGATRVEINALVAKVANATGRTAYEVNSILLRRGHPRRAECTQADLDLIREDLQWELQRLTPQTASLSDAR